MIRRLLSFVVCALLSWGAAWPVVIIVHGTHATTRPWWGPSGGFYREIERQAALFGETVVPFGWSSFPFPTAENITIAGTALAKLIESYPYTERITIIAHSHGGNVVNMASQALFNPLEKMLARLSSKPIREQLQEAYAAIAKLPSPTGQTLASFIAPRPGGLHHGFDHTYTLRHVPGIKEAVAAHKASDAFKASGVPRKRNIIDRAIYLGTPVDDTLYLPQMDVIGSLLNVYSHGDKIQPVAGFFDRRYRGHEHISNLQVLVRPSGKAVPYAPNHSAIHAPYIGRWLLLMPEVLALADTGKGSVKEGNNGFKQFGFGKDGLILFDEDEGPSFVPADRVKAYLQELAQRAMRGVEGPGVSGVLSDVADVCKDAATATVEAAGQRVARFADAAAAVVVGTETAAQVPPGDSGLAVAPERRQKSGHLRQLRYKLFGKRGQ